jgi:transketolase
LEKQATREAYGLALAELGEKYENLVVLDADLSKSTKTVDFAKKYPDRFINVGIAEQDMMGIAAGLSVSGKIVFASSFAMFAAGRAFEIIRNSIAYPRCNVKIGATHAGITVGEDGGSHQAIEDIALMRSIPNMTVVVPADGVSTRQAVHALCAMEGPAYLRLGRLAAPLLYQPQDSWALGKGNVLLDGTEATIVACGMMVGAALEAARALRQEGRSVAVVDMATIKPLDESLILEMARKTGRILTVEEHTVIGGLGGAVAEVCGRYRPVPVWRMGIEDVFGQSGKPEDLVAHYRLTAAQIVENIYKLLAFSAE